MDRGNWKHAALKARCPGGLTRWLMSFCLSLLAGCTGFPKLPAVVLPVTEPPRVALGVPTSQPRMPDQVPPRLKSLTQRLTADPRRNSPIALSVDGNSEDVAAALSVYGVNVVLAGPCRGIPIRGSWSPPATVEHLLAFIVSAMPEGTEVFQRDGFVYVGLPQESDRRTEVFFAPSGEPGEWRDAMKLGASLSSELAVIGDMVVIRDGERGLNRAAEFQRLVSASRRQYGVDVIFVELSESQASTLGIRFTLQGMTQLGLAAGGITGSINGPASLEALLTGVIDGTGSRTTQKAYSSAHLHLVEGEKSTMQIGDSINIPRRVVTDQGTVSDVGVQTFSTGVLLSIRVRGLESGRVRLDVEPEVSEVKEVVNGYPTIGTRKFSSACFVGPESTVVLGGLSRGGDFRGNDLFPGLPLPTSSTRRYQQTRLFVFLQLHEVD